MAEIPNETPEPQHKKPAPDELPDAFRGLANMFKDFGFGDPRMMRPITVEIKGLGPIKGWNHPNMFEATTFEINNDIDLLGPDFEPYDRDAERIVTDWDDTQKDTGKLWLQAHQEVLHSFGFSDEQTSDQNILRLFGNIHVADTLGIDRFIKDGRQYSDEEVWQLITSRAGELLRDNPMDPLLVQALRISKLSGVHLAVWSSSPRELLEEAIRANDLEDVFDAVISVDDVEKHKPDPEGLYKAVYAMDVARGYLQEGEEYSEDKPLNMNGVWMVGDSPNDVKGGKAAGASTVWLEHPLQAHAALEKRKKELAEAAKTDSTTVRSAARQMFPSRLIRNFSLDHRNQKGTVSVDEIPLEEISSLPTDNREFIEFLTDRNQRAAIYRGEKVFAALQAQVGDKVKSVLDDEGRISLSAEDIPSYTRDELKASLDRLQETWTQYHKETKT